MNFSKEKKEIFSIRKFKSVGASSALIGSLFAASLMTTDTVLAEETASPATNLTDKQKDIDNLSKTTEGVQETGMEVNYTPDGDFEAKVEEAKGWGVTVNENDETVVKEAASMEEANRLIEELKQQYEAKKQELINAIETMKNGGTADQEKLKKYSEDLRAYNEAYEKFKNELKVAQEYNQKVSENNKEAKERYEKEYAEYLKKLEEFEAYLPVYTEFMAKNYSYLYTLAIEKAVDDEATTMGIWNTEITGGTPLKSETYTNIDDDRYMLSLDPGYWEGKTAPTYQEGKLAKVGIYSVLLKKGETITVRYSLKDGSNLQVGDPFENSQGIETDVKYVEYTYTLLDTDNASGSAVIHVTNDANIPFYEGASDYTQNEKLYSGKKSSDLLTNGVTKKDMTIRALDNKQNALRLKMRIVTPEGEKSIVDYVESMTNNLFVNAEKITKVSVPKGDNTLTEEHETTFSNSLEDIRDVENLDPNFRNTKTWTENWSGMLNTQGTGIKYRTYQYNPDTIANSKDPQDLNSTTKTKLTSNNYKFYNTLTGQEIPAGDLVVKYYDALGNVEEFNSETFAKFNNADNVGFYVYSKDPDAFYDKYVATGANIKLVHTMMNGTTPVVQEHIWNLDSARASGKQAAKEASLIKFTDENGIVKEITYDEYLRIKSQAGPYEINYTLKDIKVLDATTGEEYKKVDIKVHQNLSYADSELKGLAMEAGVTTMEDWAGAKVRPTDMEDFYNNIVQKNKNLKIVYTMASGSDVKTHEQIWDTSSYRNYNNAKQWYTYFVQGVFAQSKAKGERWVGDITWEESKFTGPFSFTAAHSGYQTITKSGWQVGGRTGTSSIGVIRSSFDYDYKVPIVGEIKPPTPPGKAEDVPVNLTWDRNPPTPPETDTKATVDLLPNYVIRVKSNLVKNVYNVEGDAKVSIHTGDVAKGSQIYWSLDLDDLPAGRKPTTSIEFKDVLPDGFIFDKALTEAKNPKYNVTYDEATHTVKFNMKMEEVAKLNEVDPTADVTGKKIYETPSITTDKVQRTSDSIGRYETTYLDITFGNIVSSDRFTSPVYLDMDDSKDFSIDRIDFTTIHPIRSILNEISDKVKELSSSPENSNARKFAFDNSGNLYVLRQYGSINEGFTARFQKVEELLGRPVTKKTLSEINYTIAQSQEEAGNYNTKSIDLRDFSLDSLDKMISDYVSGNSKKENNVIRIQLPSESFFNTPASNHIVNYSSMDNVIPLTGFPTLSLVELTKVYGMIEQYELEERLYNEAVSIPKKKVVMFNSNVDELTRRLQKYVNQGYKILLTEATSMETTLNDYETPQVVNGVYVYAQSNSTPPSRIDYIKQDLPEKTWSQNSSTLVKIALDENSNNKITSIKVIEDNVEREIFNYDNAIKEINESSYPATTSIKYFGQLSGPYKTFQSRFVPKSDNFKVVYELENIPTGKETVTATVTTVESGYPEIELFKKVDVLVPPTNGIKAAEVTSPLIFGEVVNDGAIYNNNALVTINNGNTEEGGSIITSNTVNVRTPDVKPIKANLDSTNKDIDLTPRVVGSTNYYTLTWDLDQYKDIKVTDKEIFKGFYYFDDYPEYAVKPESEKVVLKLADGTVVNNVSHATYNSVEEAPQEIKDIIAKTNLNLSKGFQVFKANDPKDFFEKYVKTGKNITIVTPMTVRGDLGRIGTYVNKAYQVDFGNGYYTNEVSNYVVYPEPTKHNENSEGANINGKTVLPGTVNYYNMYWDLDQFAGIKITPEDIAKGFYFVDDYPEEAVDIVEGATVTYNNQKVPGITVTLYNTMEEAPENVRKAFANVGYTTTGRIQVFSADNPEQFYNEYVLTGKNLKVVSPMRTKVDFVDKSYRNTAYQLNFGTATSTQTVINQTPPPPTPVKAVNNTDKVNIDGKKVLAGSDLIYTLGWDLTPYANLKATLEDVDKGFYYFDDYPEEAINPNTANAPVVRDSKGNVVTGITVTVYNNLTEAPEAIQNLVRTNNKTITGAFQVFSADSTLDFYNNYVIKGERLEITNPMIVKEELKDKNTRFVNRAFQSEFGNLINTNDVTNETVVPEPDKDVLNVEGVNINNSIVPIGSTNVYKLKWDLDQYANFVATNKEVDKGFLYVDDYPEEAVTTQDGNVVFKLDDNTVLNNVLTATTYNTLAEAPAEVKAMIEKAGITIKGAFQIFKPVDNRAFYNEYVKTGKNITIETPMIVTTTISGKEFKNNAFQIDFGNTFSTKEVTNTVSVPEPHKYDLDKDGNDINTQTVPLSTTNYYTLTWDLDQYRGMKAVNADIAKGFFMIDDFQDNAVNTQDGNVVITVSETGEVVTGVTVKTYNSIDEIPENVKKALADINFTTDGKIQLFSANNPADFFNKYVTTGRTLKVVTPMTLKDDFIGTYYNKAVQIEFNRAVATEVVNNTVVTPEPEKKNNSSDNTFNINGLVMQPGMTNNYQLVWDLDQYLNANFSPESIAKGFYFVDDFPETVLTVGTPTLVVEGTNEAVTGVTATLVNINDLPEVIKNAAKTQNIALNGTVQLFTADNAEEFYNTYVKTGKRIVITSPMTVKDDAQRNTTYANTAYQVEFGRLFATETVTNVIPPVDPHKENLNRDDVDINNTVTVRGMINKYKLHWDLDQYANNGATAKDIAKGFFFVDDYDENIVVPMLDEFSIIDPTGKPVEGLTITELASINEAPEALRNSLAKSGFTTNGRIIVISANNPSDFHNVYANKGLNLTIYAPMKVKEDLTNEEVHTYLNTGYQSDYGNAYVTETVRNDVPPVDPHKQNLNKDSVDINNTPMYVGATNYYTLTWDLDQFKGIKADKELIAKGFFFIDDYPEEAVTINVNDVKLLTSNNTDITSEFNIIQVSSLDEAPENVKSTFAKKNYAPNGAIQVFIPKDFTDFYNKYVTTGETIKIVDPMTVKEEMFNSDKSYYNTGYQVNFDSAYVTETVENHVPSVEPHKEDLNKDFVDINGTVTVIGTVHNYRLTWDLDQYKGIKPSKEDIAKGFYFVDDYPEDAVDVIKATLTTQDGKVVEGVTLNTYNSIEEAPKQVQDMIAKYNVTINGKFQVFSADNPEDFYNKYVVTGESITIIDQMIVRDDLKNIAKTYRNQGYQLEFNHLQATEIVTNNTPVVTPVKHDLNRDGVDINGTVMVAGMTNYYKLDWDLDQFKGIKPSKDMIELGFMFIDDYPEEVVTINTDEVIVHTVNGEVVDGLEVKVYNSIDELDSATREILAKQGVTIKGAFQVFKALNPQEFYEKYVLTGTNLVITDPMTIKQELDGQKLSYSNVSYQWDMGIVTNTNTVTNEIPPVDPHKQNLNKDSVDINDTPMYVGATNYYTLTWDLDQFKGIKATKEDIAKGFFFIDDYPEEAVTINVNDVKLLTSNNTDITSEFDIIQISSLDEAPENVRKAFAKKNYTPNGAIQVFIPKDNTDFYNKYVTTGETIKIVDPMTVKEEMFNSDKSYYNTGYQVNFDNAYITETVVNHVPPVDPKKDNYNNDNILINGTPTVPGMINDYRLAWDLDQYKGIKASTEDIARGFFFVDDYPEDVLTALNEVTITAPDGTTYDKFTVTVYDSIEEAPASVKELFAKTNKQVNGKFQVIEATDPTDFYNKFVTTGTNLVVSTKMVVREDLENTLKSYTNVAYQVEFTTVHTTNEVTNEVPPVEPHKQNLNKDTVDINKTPMYIGATNYYTLTWDLDQFKNIKATKDDIAKGFFFVDDFPEEAVTINVNDVKLFTTDNTEITSEFEIVQYSSFDEVPENVKKAFAKKNFVPNGAVQVFIPKDFTDFYNKYVTTGETIKIVDPMTVKEEMYNSNKSYYNTGYQVNFETAYVTETVENHVPSVEPHKEDLNKDFVDINGTVTVIGTIHNYRLTWDLDQYKGIQASKEDVAKGFYFVDDYPEDAVDVIKATLTTQDGEIVEGVTLNTYNSIEEAPKQVQDMIAKYNVTINGKFQVFSADNPEDFYNKYVVTGKSITIIDQMIVREDLKNVEKTYTNQGFQIEFNHLQATEIVTNNTPVVKPVKEDLNADGIDINGKVMAVGMTNYYKLLWKLDQYKGIKPSKDMIELGFMYIDDFPEEAVTINTDKVVVHTVDGEVVDGLEVKVYNSIEELDSATREILAKQGITIKGAFQVFKAVNPQDFYEKYVLTGTNLVITDPMTVKDELKGKHASYTNIAYQWDMGIVNTTNEVVNEVPPVEPKKQNLNKNKVNIDGKEVLANSINYYTLTWDLDQYKGIELDKETLAKGMFFVDDYPEEAVDILDDQVRFYYVDETGKEVAITDIEVAKYNSIEEAPIEVQNALKEIGYVTKGAIQVFKPRDLQSFYENYVKKGISIKIVDPMKVKESMAKTGGKYENQAIQIDFGKAHITEIVTNNLPPLKVDKEVLLNGKDVNNGIIQLGESFKYVINGTYLPGNRSEKLFEYKFVDDYQESHDKFITYKVIAKVDFTLNIDGQTLNIKENDDLTKYTTLVHENGKITIDFIDKFYNGLDESQPFQASAELYMERIAVGDVYNTFSNVVNGVEVISNTVKTSTPQPPTPPQPELPKTGDSSNVTSVLGLIMGSLGLAGLFRKKKRESEV